MRFHAVHTPCSCVFFVPRAVDGGGGRPVTLGFVKPDTDWEHGRRKAWNEVQVYAVWRKPDGNAGSGFLGNQCVKS